MSAGDGRLAARWRDGLAGWPGVGESLPFSPLGAPTRVAPAPDGLDLPGLWVKHDHEFGDGDWAGNKVRKLEWILPRAQQRGSRALFSVGGIGTHWGLALARYAPRTGIPVVLGLVDQPVDDHVRTQLARLEDSGAALHRFPDAAALRRAAPGIIARNRAWYLPAGGSNAVGTLAYVDVALEIAAQVRRGELPEPRHAVVPVGSGGTYAGLVLGFALAGLRTRVLGVVVNDMIRLDAVTMDRLVRSTARLLDRHGLGGGHLAPTRAELDLRSDWLGECYGDPTAASVAEVERAASAGIELEPVYTGKALAAIRTLRRTGEIAADEPVLWVNTHGPR